MVPHQAANGLPVLVARQDTVGGAAGPGDLFIELWELLFSALQT